MKLAEAGPLAYKDISNNENAVSEYADMVRDEAGRLIAAAAESEGEQPDGRVVTVEKAEGFTSGGEVEKVEVTGKHGVFPWLRKGQRGSVLGVKRYPDGTIEYSERRKSALRGEEVTKTVSVMRVDGEDLIRYDVVRTDANGKVIPRKGRAFRSTNDPSLELTHPTRSHGVVSSSTKAETGDAEVKREERKRTARVILPANAVRERVLSALSSRGPVERKPGVDSNGKVVEQVPKEVAKKYGAETQAVEPTETEDTDWSML